MSLSSRLGSLGAIFVLVASFVFFGAVNSTQAAPPATYPIEASYKVAGSWDVSTMNVLDGSNNVIYNLFYPTNLGADGFSHPIVTWGNGTNASPSQYSGVLNQLASWGFVVVASTSPTTAHGTEMLDGVNYMISQNDDPASAFFQKLNTNQVGALGHSQGGGGTINATNNSGGLIKTAVPINLPDERWVGPGDDFDVSQLTVPVFFVGGSNDKLIAPPATLTAYYNQVPGAAAIAVLKSAGHNTIQGTGGGYLGYLTAWMMYQLQADMYARAAFVGNPPEINIHSSWLNEAQKNLP